MPFKERASTMPLVSTTASDRSNLMYITQTMQNMTMAVQKTALH